MDQLVIQGGKALHGVVPVSGAKNAALPLLISSLLTGKTCTWHKVPALQDIKTTLKLLKGMGAEVDWDEVSGRVRVSAANLTSREAEYDLVRTMRASVVVLGPLLARYGEAKVSLPGGCAIGTRPIDLHLFGFERMGAKIELENGYVIARADQLKGARIPFSFPSVGATENVLMAAVMAEGETIMENCAREPEIVDLARALRAMGAEISGEGTETIRVRGKSSLEGCNHHVMPDRIEAGTYLAAGHITGGDVTVDGIDPDDLGVVLEKFEEAGARIERLPNGVRLIANGRPKGTDLTTQPFPGFPTDMQAQFMSVMTLAEGASVVTETIFENRFMHVPELARMGADITIRGNTALVRGVGALTGAPVMATDLRASASLVICALAAKGESRVRRIYHLDRGYERIEEKLAALGGKVERMKES
jgi:UDP-N-acetylglucosamine 1-carboxyvinyltransferase